MATKKKNAVPEARAHLCYTGRVQGVGFRYTAERFAHDLGLTGWVKNLPDNSVEIVCEGDKATIEQLLALIQKSPLGPHIKKCACDWQKPTGEFTDFQVEFYL